jgi:hypothetical protein
LFWFRYCKAPHIASTCYPGLDQFVEGPFYTWADDSSRGDESCCWDQSLDYLAKFLKENGPFDGVYGFSQGVAMITNFSHPSIWQDRFGMDSCPWKSAILACGGGASGSCCAAMDSRPIRIPSLHIFGAVDPYQSDGHKLEQYWATEHKTTYTHQKGHEIDLLILNREKKLDRLLTDFLDQHMG